MGNNILDMNDHRKIVLPSNIKTKYRIYKFLFLNIKRLDLLESAKYSGKITDKYYKEIQEQYLKEYEQFSNTIPNYNFEEFIKKFNLEDQMWAINIIKNKSN